MKKQKKIFKAALTLAPRVTLNRRWTNWRQKDSKLTASLELSVLKKLSYNTLVKDQCLAASLDSAVKKKVIGPSKLYYSSQIKNYCLFVGRPRSVSSRLFLARHTFRKFLRVGLLSGFTKSRC